MDNDLLERVKLGRFMPAYGATRSAACWSTPAQWPAVFGNVPHDAQISREEVFGPLIAVVPAR